MTKEERALANHWADIWAANVIRTKGEKDLYTCASGITPSGTVHIGNFREIISVDLVVRALRDLEKKVRFIYSWDDYDVFRKVPKNMANPELLATYLRKSIDIVPDTSGEYASYAEANEKYLENLLPQVGIRADYIYQSRRYRSHVYADGMKQALQCREIIRHELDEHRSEPLAENWYPLSIFCEACDRDDTEILSYNNDYEVEYQCHSCGHHASLDLRTTGSAKLPWRVDWPMRWSYEKVDFEPAGKDHHSEGGSFTTAKKTVQEVYQFEAPVTFQYDFVRIKGGSGKISSSSGEVVDLNDCLQIYQPQMVRFLFVSTRPNSEFAISFDLDVLKNYEDYDKVERTYFAKPDGNDPKKMKKWASAARVYELSQLSGDDIPVELPYQIQIRHLCNLLQIHLGNIDETLATLPNLAESQKPRLRARARCAWNWITNFAPEDFRFKLQTEKDEKITLNEQEQAIIDDLRLLLPEIDRLEENSFAEKLYALCEQHQFESGNFFKLCYQILLKKDQGPRLVGFFYAIGSSKLTEIFAHYP